MPPAFSFPQIPASSVSVNIGDPVDPQALEQAKAIVSSIKDADDKSKALLEKAKAFGDMQKEEESYVVPNKELKEAYENLLQTEREALDRIHAR